MITLQQVKLPISHTKEELEKDFKDIANQKRRTAWV